MRKLTKEQAAAATKLTVAYQAYFQAVHEGNLNDIIVWGRMMIEAQAATGIEMLDPHGLEFKIGYARSQLKERERRDAEVRASALPDYNTLVGV